MNFSLLLVLSTLAALSASAHLAGQHARGRWVDSGRRLKRQQSDTEDVDTDADGNADGNVDLHDGEFCVDVSTYGDVEFEEVPRRRCDASFSKRCETRTQQVCDDVTEIQCDVVPFTECEMTMEPTPYTSFQMVQRVYNRKECTEGMDTVQHTKMMPECRNVTKQNCITNWETDENGNQVWAGNEACEPVTWRECRLVPRQVDFKVPRIDCVDGEPIPYMEIEESEQTQMTTRMTCTVNHTTDCRPVVSTKCANIDYQECSEEANEECEDQTMMIPRQERIHRKKCLLQDDGSFTPSRAAIDTDDDANNLAIGSDDSLDNGLESENSLDNASGVDELDNVSDVDGLDAADNVDAVDNDNGDEVESVPLLVVGGENAEDASTDVASEDASASTTTLEREARSGRVLAKEQLVLSANGRVRHMLPVSRPTVRFEVANGNALRQVLAPHRLNGFVVAH